MVKTNVFFRFDLALCHICCYINAFRGKLPGLSTQWGLPASPPSLHPSSFYSITWQESRYFPWDDMSYCPLTTSNCACAPPSLAAFAPLPTACSQRSSSLQIKELCCLSPFSLSLSSRLSQTWAFQGQGCCSFAQIYSTVHLLKTDRLYLYQVKIIWEKGTTYGWIGQARIHAWIEVSIEIHVGHVL